MSSSKELGHLTGCFLANGSDSLASSSAIPALDLIEVYLPHSLQPKADSPGAIPVILYGSTALVLVPLLDLSFGTTPKFAQFGFLQ